MSTERFTSPSHIQKKVQVPVEILSPLLCRGPSFPYYEDEEKRSLVTLTIWTLGSLSYKKALETGQWVITRVNAFSGIIDDAESSERPEQLYDKVQQARRYMKDLRQKYSKEKIKSGCYRLDKREEFTESERYQLRQLESFYEQKVRCNKLKKLQRDNLIALSQSHNMLDA